MQTRSRRTVGWFWVGLSALWGNACADHRGEAPLGELRQAVEGERAGFGRVTVVNKSPAPVPALTPLPPPALPQAQTAWCEETPTGTLLRAECPTEPELAAPCEQEGLECRYAFTFSEADITPINEGTTELGAACVRPIECAWGFWSPLFEECESTIPVEYVAGDGACPERLPLPDVPCDVEGLSCGMRCAFGGGYISIATCTCGRWRLTHDQCGVD